MSKEGGAIVFFWYKDKVESYDSARFEKIYIISKIQLVDYHQCCILIG